MKKSPYVLCFSFVFDESSFQLLCIEQTNYVCSYDDKGSQSTKALNLTPRTAGVQQRFDYIG